MCVLLACAAPPAIPAAIVQAAKAALDNPRLCGEPALRGDLEGGQGGGAGGGGYEETATAATGATSAGEAGWANRLRLCVCVSLGV